MKWEVISEETGAAAATANALQARDREEQAVDATEVSVNFGRVLFKR